jgi:tetratricopeptide (TPR) repeat protein
MKKIVFFSAVLIGLLLSSCKKEWLDGAMPQTNIANDQWGSTVDLERVMAGAYYGISGYAGFRGIVGLQNNHEALLSDLAYLHNNAVTGDWENSLYNRNIGIRNDVANYAWMWSGAYMGLALCNEIIGWVDKNGAFNDQYGPLWTDRINGEALFLRAWINFTLVRMHGLPYGADNTSKSIILKTTPSKDPFPNPERATVQQVYDLILADLNKAAVLLPPSYRPGIDPLEYQDRANRSAAHFLLAQVYFQMKDLPRAKQYSDSVLNSNKYPLNQDPIEAFNKTGLASKGNETVWQYVQYSTAQQQWKASPIGYMFGFTSRGSNTINSGRLISASDAFLNQVGWSASSLVITNLPSGPPPGVQPTANNYNIVSTDKRLAQLWKAIPAGYDPRPEFTAYNRTYVWCNKYNRNTVGSNLLFSIPFMRSAELYLTRAYILFTQGDKVGAAADLNVVRQRAGLTPILVTDLTVDLIHQERMKELTFENDRLYYLQAIGAPIPPGDRIGVTPLDWKSPTLVIPIPNIETDVNPNAGK